VGDFFDAWQTIKDSLSTPLYYIGCFSEVGHCEWFTSQKMEKIGSNFQGGKLIIPGYSHQLSNSTVKKIAGPERPALNILVIRDDLGLAVPDSVLQQWLGHPVYGKEFEEWVEKFTSDPELTGTVGNVNPANAKNDSLKRPFPDSTKLAQP
jgi:hypothetical protein